ncbi:MAG: hypothetical protein LH645_12860, partial [Actinomycetia bacterium]|nr:hypothetical protein [Actinomycetes bacterium]
GWSATLSSLPLGLPAVAIGSVGLLIATRRPDNAIGWIYLGCGLWLSLSIAADGYTGWATVVSPGGFGGTTTEWLSNWVWAPFLCVMLTFPFLLFPDGHLLSSRWRPVAWGSGAVTVMWSLVVAFSSADYSDAAGRSKANPYTPPGLEGFVQSLEFVALGFLITLALSVWSLAVRFRRGGRREQSQIKWLILAGLVMAVFMVQALATNWSRSDTILLAVVLSLLPLSVGVAILRYHLYDIDRIISRSTSYALVTALVVVVYLGVVAAASAVIPVSDALPVALATLVAAAVFRPALRWTQTVVDRRFDRTRYDAETTVQVFSQRLAREVDADIVTDELLEVLDETVQPSSVGLWVAGGQS